MSRVFAPKSVLPLIAPSILCLVPAFVPAADSTAEVDFSRDVRSILSDRCFKCHGPDASNRQADLRLDTRDGLFAETAGDQASHVVRAGKPDDSELWRRIATTDADERMPPADSKLALTAAEIDVIRRWIEQGAVWKKHWSFESVPDTVEIPDVDGGSRPAGGIDRFILKRLEQAGLSPAERATREKLIRRATFDLTGLPPTLDEIDAFLQDTRPNAFERVVDRLLESEHFGERMAADWLDVARYSDTYGYQVDRDRFVWPWRDWVIRAFNRNLPYDRFIAEQLAGDLLPDATDEQILATTFNRLHPQKVEGGSVPEEFRVEYVADRTQTFATAFLGLTMECARCHDHKYDPVTQREYYQLFAFFNSIDEAGLYSYFTSSVPTPTLRLADAQARSNVETLRKKVAQEEQKLRDIAPARQEAYQTWRAALDPNSAGTAIPGRVAHLDFETAPKAPNTAVPGRHGQAVKLTGDDGIGLKVGNFPRFQPFSVSLWMNTPDVKQRAVVFHRSRAWTDAASRGYQLLIEDGRLSASLIHFWPGNAIRVRTPGAIPTGEWLHVVVTYDGSSRADGLRIHVDGRQVDVEIVRDNLYKNITGGGGDTITIGERFRDRGFTDGLVDEFQVYDRELTALEVAELHSPGRIAKASDDEALYRYYLTTADERYRAQLTALKSAREALSKAMDPLQEIMVMRELPNPRPTFLLTRGAYDKPSDPVEPGTPAVFPPFGNDLPGNRSGLARWLTSPDHPLTARVAVNRFWQMCFGHGLVRTPEDFGSQGARPTHPELLDWLARDFVDHGWDVKRLLKQIVLSSTYRQSSQPSDEAVRRDPENRLLSHAPSYRLSAEMLRDQALAVSGLLVDRIGGAPAKPYELEASFKPAKRDTGDGLYRRSVYTYWKRTGPAPAMMALDASKRDVCRVKRERTASPIQAFILLNAPQFVESGRMLAQSLIGEFGDDTDRILTVMFRKLTSRRPTDREQSILRELYDRQRQRFQNNVAGAEEYLGVGESKRDPALDASRLAAVSVVASTLMNYDESVMKR